jgi:hypothetical protein
LTDDGRLFSTAALPNEVSQNAYSMVVNTSYESDLWKSDHFLISLRKLFSKSNNQIEKQTITTIKVRGNKYM